MPPDFPTPPARVDFFRADYGSSKGADYTRDRHKWLPSKKGEFIRLMDAPDPEGDKIRDAIRKRTATKAKPAASRTARPKTGRRKAVAAV